MKESNPGQAVEAPEVLHYVGYDADRGGIVSVIRALGGTGAFRCVIGANPGFAQQRNPPLEVVEFSPLRGEELDLGTLLGARRVASEVRSWLRAGPRRVFHGHSRAGLAVALWLSFFGERRVAASVHCYGRHRWFYRFAKRRLGKSLYWLSPQMKRHYGEGSAGWDECVPGCVPAAYFKLPRAGRRTDALRLGGIGALASWKRWDLVLEALSRLPPMIREKTRFTHVGAPDGSRSSADYAESLKARASAPDLANVVTWAGEHPDSRELLSEVDALVVASENEPFSIAMLEAIAAGIPVIAADSGGARDVVTGGAGRLFKSGNAADLAQCIGEFAAAGPVAGNSAAAERFAAPAVAAEWLGIYRGLLRLE